MSQAIRNKRTKKIRKDKNKNTLKKSLMCNKDEMVFHQFEN